MSWALRHRVSRIADTTQNLLGKNSLRTNTESFQDYDGIES